MAKKSASLTEAVSAELKKGFSLDKFKDKKLFQSCHILHKQGKYYITHFKELFALDGKPTDITENDIARRNTVANLLEDWELIKIVTKEQTKEPTVSLSQVKIISHKEKADWELVPKYNIGKKPQATDK